MVRNILVVDDVKINRKLIKGLLTKTIEHIEILEAESAFEAKKILDKRETSVVILDIMMPEKDGIQFLKEIKQDPKMKNIPIIMCSALNEIESVQRALELGALDYFTKPLTEEQMRVTLPLKVKNALEYYEDKIKLLEYYEKVEEELELAQKLQSSMISEYKDFDMAHIRGNSISCDKIGGDMFVVKEVGRKLWFMIADVSGYGISATMISTMIGVMFEHCIEVCSSPEEVLTRINKKLYELFNGSKYGLISAFVGFITNTKLCYANAGHPYPVLYKHKTATFETLEAKGFLLGMFEDRAYVSEFRAINSEDTLLLYTDGLFDKGADQGYNKWSIVKDYCDQKGSQLLVDKQGFLDDMVQHFKEFEGHGFVDDVTLMIIHKK